MTPPRNMSAWADVVSGLCKHWVGRYGEEEIARWMVEVWNEPNIDFWAPPKEEKQATYFRLYEEAARAVKRASPRLRVGGPVTAGSPAWISDLIAYCRNRSVPLDFISTHVYRRSRPVTHRA